MQKKIIALAVAGLMSGAAFAQSNVTVYGVADMYMAHGSGDGNSVNVVNSGGMAGSRIGFRGVEDLGGGLKALFTLEYSIAADVNSGIGNTGGALNSRQTFVGLTGGFGTAVAGRLQTPGYDFGVKYDAHAASLFSPIGQLTDNAGASISGRDALARQDNAIAYVSPNFSGLTAKFAYAFGTGGENVKAGAVEPQDIWALAADYDNGPLSVGFVHHNVNDFAGVADVNQTENAIGVKYDLGMATLSASYQTQDVEAPVLGTVFDSKAWNIGARIKAGAAGSVGLSYAQIKDDVSDEKAKSWGIDYRHSLSKRTTAYVGYSRVSNSDGINFGLTHLGSTAALGGKESQFAVGMNHSF